jgi:uncharacterized protein
MKRIIIWAILLAIMLGTLPLAAAPAVPSPAGNHFYVLDNANVLSEAGEYKIQATSSQLAAKTKAQVVVVTVPSLQDADIGEYALEILRKWGVGDKQLNNGVVVLAAINDRQLRIEVGYGLEGALPDGKTGRIQDEYMLPYFKQGDYEQGIQNGYTAVVNEVAKEYNITLAAPPVKPQSRQNPPNAWDTLPWWGKILLGMGLVGLIIIDVVFFGGRITWLLLALLFRGGRGGGGSDGGSGGGGSGGGGGSSRRW